jgi:hypothetical protein
MRRRPGKHAENRGAKVAWVERRETRDEAQAEFRLLA